MIPYDSSSYFHQVVHSITRLEILDRDERFMTRIHRRRNTAKTSKKTHMLIENAEYLHYYNVVYFFIVLTIQPHENHIHAFYYLSDTTDRSENLRNNFLL
uniref:Ovule protein n=1 Tax=Ascaris lumbricoides TaxID=6252 RepID=A0A0M3IDM0_ASCLU